MNAAGYRSPRAAPFGTAFSISARLSEVSFSSIAGPDQGQQLLVLTPADAESRERLELLRVLGVEEFPTDAADAPVR